MMSIIRKVSFAFVIAGVASACGGGTSHPEITVSDVEADIIGKNPVLADATAALAGGWKGFAAGEQREISILEASYDGDEATLIVNIDTQTASGDRGGRVRLHYEWLVDDWNLRFMENMDFGLKAQSP